MDEFRPPNDNSSDGLLTKLVAASVVERVVSEIFSDPQRKQAFLNAVIEKTIASNFSTAALSKMAIDHIARDPELVRKIAEGVKSRLDLDRIAAHTAEQTMREVTRRAW
ncbi:MAG: hypothetical protein ACRCSL_16715 [Microbacterium sp.]